MGKREGRYSFPHGDRRRVHQEETDIALVQEGSKIRRGERMAEDDAQRRDCSTAALCPLPILPHTHIAVHRQAEQITHRGCKRVCALTIKCRRKCGRREGAVEASRGKCTLEENFWKLERGRREVEQGGDDEEQKQLQLRQKMGFLLESQTLTSDCGTWWKERQFSEGTIE